MILVPPDQIFQHRQMILLQFRHRLSLKEIGRLSADRVHKIHKNSSDEAKEIARLQRELRDTKDALEILKKAISILGK